MDKDIENRITIGVREWAVEKAIGDIWIETNLAKKEGGETIKNVVEVATKLEEFVLRGIKEESPVIDVGLSDKDKS